MEALRKVFTSAGHEIRAIPKGRAYGGRRLVQSQRKFCLRVVS